MVHDPGNGIFKSAKEKIVWPWHQVCDKVQTFWDYQSETRGLELKISLYASTSKFALGMNASILIPQAPDRFNLDETSLKHIGRQGLNVFWQCARELWLIHPGNHRILLGSPHRRLSVGSEAFFEYFQCTLMKLSFCIGQNIMNKLSNIEGRFELSRRTTGQKASKSTHAC